MRLWGHGIFAGTGMADILRQFFAGGGTRLAAAAGLSLCRRRGLCRMGVVPAVGIWEIVRRKSVIFVGDEGTLFFMEQKVETGRFGATQTNIS